MAIKGISRRAVLKSGAAGAVVGTAGGATGAKAATTFTSPVIRAEFYDLPAPEAASWLAWLHGEYLPKLKTSPGIVWVGHYKIEKKSGEPSQPGGLRRVHTDDPSVPTGADYVLMTAAVSPETFLGWEAPLGALEKTVEEKLSKRVGYRQSIFIEEARIDGPENNPDRDKQAPPAIQLGNFNVRTPADEFDLAKFYRLEAFKESAITPGSIGMRKFVSLIGWAKHGVLYEFAAMKPGEELFQPRLIANRKPTPVKLRPIQEYVVHAPGAPHAGARIWP